MDIDGLVKHLNVVLFRLIRGLLARVSGQQDSLYTRSLSTGIVDDLEAGMLLFQRVVAEQQIEVMLIKDVFRFDRGDGGLDGVSLFLQDEGVRSQHRLFVIDYEYSEFTVTPHNQFWSLADDRNLNLEDCALALAAAH